MKFLDLHLLRNETRLHDYYPYPAFTATNAKAEGQEHLFIVFQNYGCVDPQE